MYFLLFLFSSRCQCPAQFEGPECQQNKHSFHGNGYAWFPPIMPCFESLVSLEFITDMADGLLLYSGPLAQLQAWDHEDFLAIGRNISSLLHVPSGRDSRSFTVWKKFWLSSLKKKNLISAFNWFAHLYSKALWVQIDKPSKGISF